MADLINACLRDEMKRDERIVIFGEDVADCSREEYLKKKQVKGKGGVFKLTAGLQCEFGCDRVFNSPLAEANIVGRAVGMATRGLKPVVEIQFFDYIWPAMQQLRNELPLMRWRSNNAFLVARWSCASPSADTSPAAPSITRSAAKASSPTSPACAWSSRRTRWTPTACCAPPSAATIRFCSSSTSGSIARPIGRAPYPGPDYMIPFGKAKIVQPGNDLTVITYGAVVPRALAGRAEASSANMESKRRTHRPALAQSIRLGSDRRRRYEDQSRASSPTKTR